VCVCLLCCVVVIEIEKIFEKKFQFQSPHTHKTTTTTVTTQSTQSTRSTVNTVNSQHAVNSQHLQLIVNTANRVNTVNNNNNNNNNVVSSFCAPFTPEEEREFIIVVHLIMHTSNCVYLIE